MQSILRLFHQLLSGASFEGITSIDLTRALELPAVSAYADAEQQVPTLQGIKALGDAVRSRKDLYLLFEVASGRHESQTERHGILAIPTIIDIPNLDECDYILYPDVGRKPCINPTFLGGEYGQPAEFPLGDAENYLSVVRQTSVPATDSWTVWFEYALGLLETTFAMSLSHLLEKLEHLTKRPGRLQCCIAYAETNSAVAKIDALYRALINATSQELAATALPQPLTVLLGTRASEHLTQPFLSSSVQKAPTYLLGHMDETGQAHHHDLRDRVLFALDNTQRQVLMLLSRCQSGDVLAVNGPPGSGKTAMLKAVIAHQWVSAVVKGEPCPITMAVGATNQSVTNVIGAFPDVPYVGDSPHLQLYKRWLPHCHSYGTFLPSAERLKKEQAKQSDTEDAAIVLAVPSGTNKPTVFEWLGPQSSLSDLRQLEGLEAYYLNQARRCEALEVPTTESLTIDHVINTLQKTLSDQIHAMEACRKALATGFACGDTGYMASLLSTPNQRPEAKRTLGMLVTLMEGEDADRQRVRQEVYREVIRDEGLETQPDTWQQFDADVAAILIDRYLDMAYRAHHFHLAARYWEGRYLLDCRSRVLIARTPDNVTEGLRRLCMVTPCLVSTLHNAPSLLRMDRQSQHAPDQFVFGAVDLLIMDETGQAPIRLALPMLGLAKRAIAVGDIKQLAPVINDISLLQEQLEFHHAGLSEAQFTQCYLDGLTTSQGSMLHLMRLASRFAYQGEGLPLRGHYRCQKKIIELCNEMVYDNQLFYLPNLEKENGYFPPMSWVASSSPTQPAKNGSKTNTKEATMIVDFLLEQWACGLRDHYDNKPLGDVVAIVTPFNQQGEAIRAQLQRTVSGMPSCGITLEDVDQMTIGTVDALQGAEKPVVIFSATQGSPDGGQPFFAEQPFLINVAVSRAKASFVAFLCPELYRVHTDYTPQAVEALKPDSIGYLGYYLARMAPRLFPKKLVVIEAAGKLKALQTLLGTDYEVIATNGAIHKLGLEETALSSKTGLRPRYQLTDNGHQVMDVLAKKAAVMEHIILATDDDYVGEAIAWHVYHQLRQRLSGCEEKFSRVRLNAITESAVKQAFAEPSQIDNARVSAEVAREIIDILMARKLYESLQRHRSSRDYSGLARQGVSMGLVSTVPIRHQQGKQGVGRVKSGVLDLLLKQAKQSLAQTTTPVSFNIQLRVNGKTFKGTLTNPSGVLAEKIQATLQKGRPMVSKAPKAHWAISHQDKTPYTLPPTGTATVEILQRAWQLHRLPPREVMAALQGLYEGNG